MATGEAKFDHKTTTDMGQVEGHREDGSTISGVGSGGYYLVQEESGMLKCSCGRALNKVDEYTYKCEGGYPIYRPEDGTVSIDKFGNLMLKVIPHGQENKNI